MRNPSRSLAGLSVLLPCMLFWMALPSAAGALSKKQSEQAGAVLFRDKGCTFCHGVAGEGTARGPSLADTRKTKNAAQITSQIENGSQKMPRFKDALTPDEVSQLVSFLRAKHRPVPPPAHVSAPLSNPAQ
jgi:mono/diheme cytochrome c family protein